MQQFLKVLLIRSLNISRSYFVTSELFKQFADAFSIRHIRLLDVSGCYWIPAQTLIDTICTMSELRELHVNDTSLTVMHLAAVFRSCRKIRSLSISFSRGVPAELSQLLNEMQRNTGDQDGSLLRRRFAALSSLKMTFHVTTRSDCWFHVLQILR